VAEQLNIFFDVDHTLVHVTQHLNSLRPGTKEVMKRMKDAGHTIFVWSAGGEEYSKRTVEKHNLGGWVEDCFDKHPKVDPKPDIIIDDDWYLVEKYGGYVVSQYKEVDESDRELLEIIEKLALLGHL
jgi:FMN phosphatase YigB (HAD superfamily)